MDPNTQQPNRFDPQVNPDDVPEHTAEIDPAQSEADRQERLAHLQSLVPPKKPRRKLVGVSTVLAIVAVLAGGAVAYFLLTPSDDDTSDTQTTQTKPTETKPQVTKPVAASETFDSATFGFSIKYPKGWEPAENNGKLTITSPSLQLKNVSNKPISGQVVINVSAKGQDLSAFSSGNGGAVLDSLKLTYKTPSAVQRAQTYLSFVQYPATTIPGALDALYVTGDFGYLVDQAVPLVDLSKLDPVVSVTFLCCVDAGCGTAAASPISAENWSDPIFATPIQTTLESLTFNEF